MYEFYIFLSVILIQIKYVYAKKKKKKTTKEDVQHLIKIEFIQIQNILTVIVITNNSH